MNKPIKLLIHLSIFLMALTAAFTGASAQEKSLQSLDGVILINIQGSECHEYVYRPAINSIQKIAGTEIITEENNGRKVCRSSNFKTAWSKVRAKQFLSEEQVKDYFGRFDLSNLYPLTRELFHDRHNDCYPQKTFKLREISPIHYQKNDYAQYKYELAPRYFSINDQKSYAVYIYSRPALLIDWGNKTISNTFCYRCVNMPVWDSSGQYLAYTTATPTSRELDEFIAVTQIKDKSVIMEKRINDHVEETMPVRDEVTGKMQLMQWNPSTRKYEYRKKSASFSESNQVVVADIAWNPASNHIAVLSYKGRIKYYLPWELLVAAAGHAIVHKTFFLSIYDMTGKEVLTQKIVTDVAHGRGTLVWTDDKTMIYNLKK